MIKVGDFGMSEKMDVRNYFRRDKSEEGSEEKVPIRWMAPESTLHATGQYTGQLMIHALRERPL